MKQSLVFLLLVLFSLRVALANCDEVSDVIERHRPFPTWNFIEAPSFSVNDFLPPSYLQALHAAGFTTTIKVDSGRTFDGVNVQIYANNHLVLKFLLRQSKEYKGLELSELRIEDPLNEIRTAKLDQSSPGVSLKTFMYLRDRFYQMARSGGRYRTVTCSSSQNYLVSMLYQKVLGFYPATAESREFTEFVDQVYRAVIKIDSPFVPKTRQEFTEALGYSNRPTEGLDLKRKLLWELTNGITSPETSMLTLVKDDLQRPIAVYGIYQDRKMFFIVYKNKDQSSDVIDWRQAADYDYLRLVKVLPGN